MSNYLKEFLRQWIEWVDAGAASGGFDRDRGLCGNFGWWLLNKCDADVDLYNSEKAELKGVFESEGLDGTYPFGESEYDRDIFNSTMHTDEKRIAWVRSKVGQVAEA